MISLDQFDVVLVRGVQGEVEGAILRSVLVLEHAPRRELGSSWQYSNSTAGAGWPVLASAGVAWPQGEGNVHEYEAISLRTRYGKKQPLM